MSRRLLILCCLVPPLLAACGGAPVATTSPPPPALVAELQAERGDVHPRMLLTGELDAEEAVFLTTPDVDIWPVSIRWIVEDGDSVKEGDVVIDFDNTQLLSSYEDLLTTAYEAEAQLEDEEARLAGELAAGRYSYEKMKAEAEKASLEAAVPSSIQAERDYEQKQLAKKSSELRLAQQERELASLEATRDSDLGVKRLAVEKAWSDANRAQDSIDRLTVRAPRDGLVIVAENWREDRPWKPGDSAFPGMTIAKVPDLKTLYVRAQLFDVDAGRLHAGQRVRARLDAFPDKVYEGTVREVGEVASVGSRRSQRRFFTVVIDLDETDPERMLPGMSVQVVVEETLSGVLRLPRQSLDFSEAEPRARLADGGFAEVVLGPCDVLWCAVEDGIAEGTRLAAAREER